MKRICIKRNMVYGSEITITKFIEISYLIITIRIFNTITYNIIHKNGNKKNIKKSENTKNITYN